MARGRKGVSVDIDTRQIRVRAKTLPAHIESRVAATVAIGAAEASAYAKTSARWMDDTGAARTGLFAVANKRGAGRYEIILAHAVSYGIWLEVRWNGRYAIIEQTLHHVGDSVMSRMRRVL